MRTHPQVPAAATQALFAEAAVTEPRADAPARVPLCDAACAAAPVVAVPDAVPDAVPAVAVPDAATAALARLAAAAPGARLISAAAPAAGSEGSAGARLAPVAANRWMASAGRISSPLPRRRWPNGRTLASATPRAGPGVQRDEAAAAAGRAAATARSAPARWACG
jgi:hypothetical protein